MVILYTTYYNEKSPSRKDELKYCLDQNLENSLIDRIFLLNESDKEFDIPKIISKKLNRRPHFNDFFDLINQNSTKDDISIIANSDIFFDETLKYLNNYQSKNVVLALTRWNMFKSGPKLQDTYFYSQDTWVFFGRISKIDGDFNLGSVGGDNRLAFEIRQANYKLLNPALTLKTYHYHNHCFKNFYDNNFPDRVPPPYYYPIPTISKYDENLLILGKLKLQLEVINYWIKQLYLRKFIKSFGLIRRKIIQFMRRNFPCVITSLKKTWFKST